MSLLSPLPVVSVSSRGTKRARDDDDHDSLPTGEEKSARAEPRVVKRKIDQEIQDVLDEIPSEWGGSLFDLCQEVSTLIPQSTIRTLVYKGEGRTVMLVLMIPADPPLRLSFIQTIFLPLVKQHCTLLSWEINLALGSITLQIRDHRPTPEPHASVMESDALTLENLKDELEVGELLAQKWLQNTRLKTSVASKARVARFVCHLSEWIYRSDYDDDSHPRLSGAVTRSQDGHVFLCASIKGKAVITSEHFPLLLRVFKKYDLSHVSMHTHKDTISLVMQVD